jgi:hypothetical protein
MGDVNWVECLVSWFPTLIMIAILFSFSSVTKKQMQARQDESKRQNDLFETLVKSQEARIQRLEAQSAKQR